MSIDIIRAEHGWILEAKEQFALPREELFAFFADAGNLEMLTPPWLHFDIQTPLPIQMQQGALIDYSLRVHGIPIKWKTEIAVWEPPFRFVDQQLRGPYKLWRHEHIFEEIPEGTLMTDRVEYQVPFGKLIHSLIVRRDLEKIFQYRQSVLTETFPCVLTATP